MYDRTRSEGFGSEVKRRIMLGTYALSAGYYDAYYAQAQKIRTLIVRDYGSAWESYDVLVSPTSPSTAFQARREDRRPSHHVPVGHLHHTGEPRGDTRPVACRAGSPTGLPVGFQVMGPPLAEMKLLNVAYALEGALDAQGVYSRAGVEPGGINGGPGPGRAPADG